MFKKTMLLFFAISLVFCLASLMAADQPQVSSTDRQQEEQGQVDKITNVSEMRTVTLKRQITLIPMRSDNKVTRATVQRDTRVKDGISPTIKQSEQGKKVVQSPKKQQSE